MRRSLGLLTLAAVFPLLASCRDARSPVAPDGAPPPAAPDIIDGTSGAEGANPHFFWLPPMVGQPDASLLGSFDPAQRPALRLVCWETNDPAVSACDPTVPIAEFTVGAGMVVETDHYKVEFDTKALELATSDGTTSTTYQLLALTPPLDADLFPGLDVSRGPGLGSYAYGLADVQLGANGGAARSLSTDETIGLKDGRTLPVRFRLDEGALEHEIRVNTAEAAPEPGQALCQINCSVTVIDADEPTEASLENADGEELTAMLVPAGAVWTDETAVLVIDQRATEGEADNCAPGASIQDSDCFRYELSPDNPDGDDFTEAVRFGICPTGDVLQNGTIDPRWRLFKFDEGGDPELTRPEEVDVTDFLACEVTTTPTVSLWNGPGGGLAGAALTWLVRPLRASDLWGGQLRDLSDLFWGLDASFPEEDFDAGTLEAGLQVGVGVTILATHPEPDVPAEGISVTFTLTDGTGELAVPDGVTAVATERDADDRLVAITLLTDENGQALVDYTIGQGTNVVQATSDQALGGPWTFTVTGTAVEGVAFADVVTGETHSCGLTLDGRVFCWGANGSGQLGDGSTTSSPTPVQVASPEAFVALDAGGFHSCAIASDGDLYCWGRNGVGQLGDGTTTTSAAPVLVSGGQLTFDLVDVGWDHTCAIGRDGVTYCWGADDRQGMLGDGPGSATTCSDASRGDVPCSPSPRAVGSGFTTVSAGVIHTCALDDSGAAFCWGTDVGSFGNGVFGAGSDSPVPAFDGLTLASIAAGAGYSCAVDVTGGGLCSGAFNDAGQLGNGTTDDTSTPTPVVGNLDFREIVAHDGNSTLVQTCGVTTGDVGYCWGSNFRGELGAPADETCTSGEELTFGCSTAPLAIDGALSFRAVDPGGGFSTEGGGVGHTCGVTTDDRLFCWGLNNLGQLGDGTTVNRSTPREVTLP